MWNKPSSFLYSVIVTGTLATSPKAGWDVVGCRAATSGRVRIELSSSVRERAEWIFSITECIEMGKVVGLWQREEMSAVEKKNRRRREQFSSKDI
uniref:PH domain-containing protein n=1 Tax=Cannabis sativa TaxID=3483 RepID=A0A803Q5N2_CANSA